MIAAAPTCVVNQYGHFPLLREGLAGDRTIDIDVAAADFDCLAGESDDALHAVIASTFWAAKQGNFPSPRVAH